MMMARAWLILADTLVHLFLFFSFILFYVNVPSYTHLQTTIKKSNKKQYCQEKNILLGKLPLPRLDFNVTMDFDDIRRIGQNCSVGEYYMEENEYLKETLQERLTSLSAKVGDPLFIRIFKEEAILEVWIDTGSEYEHLKDYIICAYSGYLGPKLKEGDRQAPEGFYKVGKRQLNPKSKYHLSFNLGYPNKYDRVHNRTGTFLMVHGNCVSIGCYAMTDEKIEEIYALVEGALDHGQRYVDVHAFPFRLNDKNMNLYEGNKWYEFWSNLKEGYDYFEAEKFPPKIRVKNKRYEILEAKE